ncbi:SPOR domain-containing protein [Fulvivirga lutimaris]|uniref:SPOR domain-containing protein n=1 Tax=Fulvivirga lutimaris TaxID=1819566 RepID=UPI001629B5C6|nr:SPOR domain-containing protein [Fulvivirga lutimaris]
MKHSYLLLLVVIVAFNACSPSITTNTSSVEVYSEDLSVHRQRYEMPKDNEQVNAELEVEAKIYPAPTFDVTTQLNSVLDSIDRLKSDVNYVDGYTVQVYSGTSSDEAKIARGKVYTILPESSPTLKYDEPNFKVRVGKFYNRLEAQKTYSRLKKRFSSTIIIPERIYIN